MRPAERFSVVLGRLVAARIAGGWAPGFIAEEKEWGGLVALAHKIIQTGDAETAQPRGSTQEEAVSINNLSVYYREGWNAGRAGKSTNPYSPPESPAHREWAAGWAAAEERA